MADQILFDKLIYIDRLKRAGVSDEQARAHAEAIDEALRETVVTVPVFRHELGTLRSELREELARLENRLTIRFGGIVATATAVLIGIKFFG